MDWTRKGKMAKKENCGSLANPNKKTKEFMGWTRTGRQGNNNVVCLPNPNKNMNETIKRLHLPKIPSARYVGFRATNCALCDRDAETIDM